MNEHEEPPPAYEEKFTENTPLIQPNLQDQAPPTRQPKSKALVKRVAVALLAACLILSLVIFVPLRLISKVKEPEVPVRIAIIGAGPAGVSTAFTLHKLTNVKGMKIDVTIFEEKNAVGGRMLMSGKLSGQDFSPIRAEYVAGGNLLCNRILRERVAKWLKNGFSKDWESYGKAASVGFFDGEKLVSVATRPVTESGWSEWLGRIFLYGPSVWRAKNLPTGTMKRFDTFLDLAGAYEDVEQMLTTSDNEDSVTMNAVERLRLNGLSKKYIEEVLGPQVRRQTGQDIEEMSDLALSMALQREEQGIQVSELGGRLSTSLDEFSLQSRADLRLCTRVSGLKKEMVDEGKDGWILQYGKKESSQDMVYEMFDKVIIAAPWNTSSLISSDSKEYVDQIQFRSQWITFLVSKNQLKVEDFGRSATLPPQILPINSSKLPRSFQGIQEINYLKDVVRFDPGSRKYHSEYLYRILSQNPIENSTIFQFIENFDDDAITGFHQERIENAYPLLHVRSEYFPRFKVSDGLWHTGVIEVIGSSVDISWVAGENVARLVTREIEKERK